MDVKREELRAGNWLYSNFQEEFYQIQAHHIGGVLNRSEPIPLTEEWLLKFGFGKCEEHALSKKIDERLSIIYDWHFNMLYMVVTFPDGDELSHSFTHIEHVHELQNFWHSLSAEELVVQELTA